MRPEAALAKRCMLCFFRDRQGVFFSLLAVLIVLLLYLMVIRDTFISAYKAYVGVPAVIDAFMLADIVAIAGVTAPIGSIHTMIDDRLTNRGRDLGVTPMSSTAIAIGYVLGAFLVSLIMSLLLLAVTLVYLVVSGCPLGAADVLMAALLTVPSALSGAIIVFTVALLIRGSAAYSGLVAIVSAMSGFVAGVYIPMGEFPAAIGTAFSCFPVAQLTMLYRHLLGGPALDVAFAGADPSAIADFKTELGYDLTISGVTLSPELAFAISMLITAVCFAIAVLLIKKQR